MAGAAWYCRGGTSTAPASTRLLNEERVTFAAGVPTVWLGLLQHLRASGERLETVKRIVTGGSACPPLLIEAFEREYGITCRARLGHDGDQPGRHLQRPEAGPGRAAGRATMRLRLKQGRSCRARHEDRRRSTARSCPGTACRSAISGAGPWVCAPTTRAAARALPTPDGWFATGDVATIDPDGFMEITDRSKDVIKSGGEWISSITLENIAVSHPDVAEAAVVAARHPKWDERPLLLVVPKPGRHTKPVRSRGLRGPGAPRWWLPDAVVVVDELPHTATGKLQQAGAPAAVPGSPARGRAGAIGPAPAGRWAEPAGAALVRARRTGRAVRRQPAGQQIWTGPRLPRPSHPRPSHPDLPATPGIPPEWLDPPDLATARAARRSRWRRGWCGGCAWPGAAAGGVDISNTRFDPEGRIYAAVVVLEWPGLRVVAQASGRGAGDHALHPRLPRLPRGPGAARRLGEAGG